MQQNLAIVIVGHQNSGKTTTLKYFCNAYFKQVNVFKMGWRYGLTPFHPKYEGVKINAYFHPSSPTEKNIPLIDSIEELDWYPEFLFIAEQLNGHEYQNSINTLRRLDYHINEFVITDSNPDEVWRPYLRSNEKTIQRYRTEAIAEYVRRFILSRI